MNTCFVKSFVKSSDAALALHRATQVWTLALLDSKVFLFLLQARVVKQLKGKQIFFAKCAKVLPAGQRRKPRTKAPEATACQVRKKEKATKLAQLFCKSCGGVWRERRK